MSVLGKVAMGFGASVVAGVIGNIAVQKDAAKFASEDPKVVNEAIKSAHNKVAIANAVGGLCFLAGVAAAVYEAVTE